MNSRQMLRLLRLVAIFGCFCGVASAQPPPLGILSQELPTFDAGVEVHVFLRATGGAAPYVWSLADGELPDGITLSPEGLIFGRASKPGAFGFTVKVEDSGRPAHSITKDFRADVQAPLLLEWLESPKVHDDRIDGSLQVSNSSKDPFDLTVVIVAVAENGRATAIGYEHFELKAGFTNVKIPFGNSLPSGAYTIHADAVAEIAARKAILRQRLQTQPLQIVQSP